MTQVEMATAGFDLDESAHARLSRFVELLLEENTKLNLTAIRDADKVWPLHICDSLAIAPLIESAGAKRIIDLGSGGGLPGIPLACADPSLQVTLLDSTRKKIAALERIIAGINLPNVSTQWGRAETLAHEPDLRQSFDGLTARAVAALPLLIEYAAGFVRTGGHCWFSKSCGVEDEIAAAAGAAQFCRLRLVKSHRFSLPDAHGDRLILEYEKTAETPAAVPRQSGLATRRPL